MVVIVRVLGLMVVIGVCLNIAIFIRFALSGGFVGGIHRCRVRIVASVVRIVAGRVWIVAGRVWIVAGRVWIVAGRVWIVAGRVWIVASVVAVVVRITMGRVIPVVSGTICGITAVVRVAIGRTVSGIVRVTIRRVVVVVG